MQAWSARVSTSATNSSPSKADLSSVPVSPSSSSIGSLHRQLSLQKSSARRSHRRKMVAECKGLRAQVMRTEIYVQATLIICEADFQFRTRVCKGAQQTTKGVMYQHLIII